MHVPPGRTPPTAIDSVTWVFFRTKIIPEPGLEGHACPSRPGAPNGDSFYDLGRIVNGNSSWKHRVGRGEEGRRGEGEEERRWERTGLAEWFRKIGWPATILNVEAKSIKATSPAKPKGKQCK